VIGTKIALYWVKPDGRIDRVVSVETSAVRLTHELKTKSGRRSKGKTCDRFFATSIGGTRRRPLGMS